MAQDLDTPQPLTDEDVHALISFCETRQGTREEREGLVLRLARAVCAQEEIRGAAEVQGATELFVSWLHWYQREDFSERVETALDVLGAAVAALARATQEREVEEFVDSFGVQVVGAAVGAAQNRPARLQVYRFPRSGLDVKVQESKWQDAKRAWRVWGAAPILAHILDSAPGLVRGEDVLELGAGCGMCGLLANALGAAQVLLTDGEKGSMAALERSADVQEAEGLVRPQYAVLDWAEDSTALATFSDREVPAEASGLDAMRAWDATCSAGAAARHERVIASDVIYSKACAVSFPASLARRLALSPTALATVVCAVRNRRLMETAIEEMQRYGLAVTVQRVTMTTNTFDQEITVDCAENFQFDPVTSEYSKDEGLYDTDGRFVVLRCTWRPAAESPRQHGLQASL